MSVQSETIVAAATPPGRGGVAIVRVSGSLVKKIAENMLGMIPEPRYATFSRFFDQTNDVLDEGIALFFPAPHSFTGEDVLELHGHGGPAIVDCVIKRILSLGARLAKPGEFSERAFLNDKIDLVQAEAIADLIHASSEQAVRSAMRSLQGEFSNKINQLVTALIHLRVYVEAAIDFVEEEIDFLADQQIAIDLAKIIEELELIQQLAKQGSLLRDGITVVIAGQPNVGKSSLLNKLSGKDIAIVTDIPGTTRDLLREHIIIDGIPIHVIDTAGLRNSHDVVEQEGIRRAKSEMIQADIILFVIDASSETIPQLNIFIDTIPDSATIVMVRNKIDLFQESASLIEKDNQIIVSISAKSGDGIDLLKKQIKACAGYQTTSANIFSARQRHLDALTRAKIFLQTGQQQLQNQRAGELLAEDLRLAQLALNEITGEFTSDDLLGKIFSSFCIGK